MKGGPRGHLKEGEQERLHTVEVEIEAVCGLSKATQWLQVEPG